MASYFLVNCVGPHIRSEHIEELEEVLSRYTSLAEPLLTKVAASDPTLAAQLITRVQALIQTQVLRRIVFSWLAREQLSSTSLALLQVLPETEKSTKTIFVFMLQASADIDSDMLHSPEVGYYLKVSI